MGSDSAIVTDARWRSTFAEALPGMFTDQAPVPVDDPTLVRFNSDLAELIGLGDLAELPTFGPGGKATLAQIFSGNEIPNGARPISQAYAGHQFGSYNPGLGDGRAVLIGELHQDDGSLADVALKGSGRTPFSRNGDGRASLGPVLREYLMGEAMHALGVPTTRALAAVTTGETVRRTMPEPGAVLTRVAASHLRVGTFQYAAATGDVALLDRLTRYALWRHPTDKLADDEAIGAATPRDAAATLLGAVVDRQAHLIAQWMHLGFIHGVMNTDNMTISGETIDYGPCAFMETYHPAAVFSSIDHGGRYAYQNQPVIALWNLARLAESLLPLLLSDGADGLTDPTTGVDVSDDVSDDVSHEAKQAAIDLATEILDRFEPTYDDAWLSIARAKLGAPDASRDLAEGLLGLFAEREVDFTLGWRRLADAAAGDDAGFRELLGDGEPVETWLGRWYQVAERSETSVATMRRHSPIYVPRNHLVEQALAAAVDGNLDPFEQLLTVLQSPFIERDEWSGFAEPADPTFTKNYVTYCGT